MSNCVVGQFVLSISPTLSEEVLREVVVDTLMECLKDGNAWKFHSSAYHKFIHTLVNYEMISDTTAVQQKHGG
ncbi:hypothetical protein L1987_13685 [Smallanthus sonchifolius]|uniref:Uncharacterized protein n=1 Tax=Smallanthus sonchifolius TaxID=185202 RepID=A0ACB9JH53_9ASTR|nr:hypothetical protein L1987_13685 [Smallanthus sonchifolius]